METGPGDDGEMVIVSEKYQISMSPGGTLYSFPPATTPEEEARQQDQFAAYMAEEGGAGEDDVDFPLMVGMRKLTMEIQELDDDDEEEEPTKGRKRGAARSMPLAAYRCDYIGCGKRFNTKPLSCPSPNKGEEDVDLEGRYCSYECMSAWAEYEIGDPLREPLLVLIAQRAGRPVESALPPYLMKPASAYESKAACIDDGDEI
jgi:hypothetical protein